MAVDWSELPPEMISAIADQLKLHIDYIRFRAVCKSWRLSTKTIPIHLPSQLPWLMLPQNGAYQTRRRGFFSISSNKLHFLNLPEASHRRRSCGSSHGWLVILDESPSIFLLNPLTRERINLPPLSVFPNVVDFDFYRVGREYILQYAAGGDTYARSLKHMRDYFIKKVILSTNPSNDSDFIALAILNQSGDLAFCKKGDQSWRIIENAQSYCEDVIYRGGDGLFYAVDNFGKIAVCDLHGDSPRVSFIELSRQRRGDMQYLVESSGELLLVTRYLDYLFIDNQFGMEFKTVEFKVHKLDISGPPKWDRVESLGNLMLFLGENSSMAFSASDFHGCKGNSIYFTDDYSDLSFDGCVGNQDIGIYNFDDDTLEQLPCYPYNSNFRLRWPPPIWISPNPC
ncbi:F-box protein SKIP23-like [Impatiens glandulifera]|uniref:F-box protein SKIP23-like n=1 Tax=Impatiens glandulifera TaxID=253017 RepID=UPI001FB0CDCD|nr:F-box protein SKIP23-like [Impatiens glandulifera]